MLHFILHHHISLFLPSFFPPLSFSLFPLPLTSLNLFFHSKSFQLKQCGLDEILVNEDPDPSSHHHQLSLSYSSSFSLTMKSVLLIITTHKDERIKMSESKISDQKRNPGVRRKETNDDDFMTEWSSSRSLSISLSIHFFLHQNFHSSGMKDKRERRRGMKEKRGEEGRNQ